MIVLHLCSSILLVMVLLGLEEILDLVLNTIETPGLACVGCRCSELLVL